MSHCKTCTCEDKSQYGVFVEKRHTNWYRVEWKAANYGDVFFCTQLGCTEKYKKDMAEGRQFSSKHYGCTCCCHDPY